MPLFKQTQNLKNRFKFLAFFYMMKKIIASCTQIFYIGLAQVLSSWPFMPPLIIRYAFAHPSLQELQDHRRKSGGSQEDQGRKKVILFCLSFCCFADVDNICFYGIKKYQENVCKIQIKIISLHSENRRRAPAFRADTHYFLSARC